MSLDVDIFEMEYKQFGWDAHILIQGTLQASIRFLGSEAQKQLSKLEAALKNPNLDPEHEHYWVDAHADVLATLGGQERFLRNMALVALTSRLSHTLRLMAKHAEVFSRREKGRYGTKKTGEFGRVWAEYSERFGIDVVNDERVAFVESMAEVRNRIVHAGGEANTVKPIDDPAWRLGTNDIVETDWSSKYPEYVSGTGISAEVNVSRELLDKNMLASLQLVMWLAVELRKRELASKS